eukprot:CAMPEP_0202747236 /NCGR_PEP_ID=MMETSP1388-20130828/8825_1 /ASSEMBLY_ACC=CAM_ASM_000864 /TAXON_ID=37098 /ORGANISM="Isochrysis sp, Strain CCMP1244" /LENGTH=342 /DNA_ID=CAMNT_0049414569 /DNA_START=69 /DNA_END=1096 /DNA_ORIENTATION=+
MPIILARHAERLDYVERDAGRNWIASSAQPWNTPLTGAGGLQAAALGRAIARHIEAHRLPPVTRIYCSPLLRCVQTAAAAAAALASASGIGIDARIDLSLMEHMGEAWYRSWCIGGVSDSTWGGPDGRKAWGTPVDEALIHPLAKRSASELLPRTNAEFLASLQARGVASSEGASSLSADLVGEMELLLRAPGQGGDTGAGTVVEADFRWGEFETHAREEERVTRLFDYVAKAAPPRRDSAARLARQPHLGPISPLAEEPAAGRGWGQVAAPCHFCVEEEHACSQARVVGKWPPCQYCGLYVLVAPREDGSWEAPVVADSSHCLEVKGSTLSGKSDAAEQSR